MDHFTQALHVTHVYDQSTPASQRLAAEEYLMQLRNSLEGLNLSVHIITQEPINEIRYFWSFNTIIQHIPSIATAVDIAQAEELLDTLLSFCYRAFFATATMTAKDSSNSGRRDDMNSGTNGAIRDTNNNHDSTTSGGGGECSMSGANAECDMALLSSMPVRGCVEDGTDSQFLSSASPTLCTSPSGNSLNGRQSSAGVDSNHHDNDKNKNNSQCAVPADFLLNKHAQLMVTGLRAFYPSRWQSFFGKLHHLLQAGRLCGSHVMRNTVTVYFLRVYQYVDEVIVSGREHGRDGVRGRDMEIKDAMRVGSVIEQAVSLWYSILAHSSSISSISSSSETNTNVSHGDNNHSTVTNRNCTGNDSNTNKVYNNSNNNNNNTHTNHNENSSSACYLDTAKLCLNVVYSYAEWIDIRLLITTEWVGLVCYVLGLPALRTAACEVLLSLVEKKQLPGAKMESLRALAVREVVPRLVSMLEQCSEGYASAGKDALQPSPHGAPYVAGEMRMCGANTAVSGVCSHRHVWGEDELAFAGAVTKLCVATAEQFLQLLDTCTTGNCSSDNSNSNSNGAVMRSDCSAEGQTVFFSRPPRDGTQSSMSSMVYDVPFAIAPELIQLLSTALHDTASELIRLMSLGVDDVQEDAIPFVQVYLKSSALHEQEATAILEATFEQIVRLALDETESQQQQQQQQQSFSGMLPMRSNLNNWNSSPGMQSSSGSGCSSSNHNCDTLRAVGVEQDDASVSARRKVLHNLIRLIYRRYSDVVLRHLKSLIVAVTTTTTVANINMHSSIGSSSSSDNNSSPLLEGCGASSSAVQPTEAIECCSSSSGWDVPIRLTQRLFRIHSAESASAVVASLAVASRSHSHVDDSRHCPREMGSAYGEASSSSCSALWMQNYSTALTESVLRYLYELGEAVRLERLRDAEDGFTCLFIRVLNSESITQHRCPQVHMAFFDLLDRYYLFFLTHRCHIPTLLHRLLLMPCGVVNTCDRARGRVCYVLNHLVNVLKPCLLPFAADVLRALQSIVYTTTHLLPSDRQQLYEAMGGLLRILLNDINSNSSSSNSNISSDGNGDGDHCDASSQEPHHGEPIGSAENGVQNSATYRREQSREYSSLVRDIVSMAANYLVQQQQQQQQRNHDRQNSNDNNYMNNTSSDDHNSNSCNTLREGEAVGVAISYFTSLAKGLGTAVTSTPHRIRSESITRRSSSTTHGSNRANCYPCDLSSSNNSNSTANNSNSNDENNDSDCGVDLMHDLFLRVTHEVITSVEMCALSSVAVREAAGQYFHQLVNHMPFELICGYIQRYIVAALYGMSAVPELSRLLRLVYQTIQRTGCRACGLVTTVLPLLWEKVSQVGGLGEGAAPLVCMDVISESARERIDVYRQLFVFLSSAASHGCGRVLWQLHGLPNPSCCLGACARGQEVSHTASMQRMTVQSSCIQSTAFTSSLQQQQQQQQQAQQQQQDLLLYDHKSDNGNETAAAAAAAAVRRRCLDEIFGQLLEALKLPADLELHRIALQVFAHLVTDCANTMCLSVRDEQQQQQQQQQQMNSYNAHVTCNNGDGEVKQCDESDGACMESRTVLQRSSASGAHSHTQEEQQQQQHSSTNDGNKSQHQQHGDGMPGIVHGEQVAVSTQHAKLSCLSEQGANDYADTRDFVNYVLSTVLPTAVQTLLLNPQFNPRDAKNFMLLGEWITLSKSVIQLCGDTALQILYTELGNVVGEEQAMQFCLLLRDTPQVTTSLKIQLRNILEQRRVATQHGAH